MHLKLKRPSRQLTDSVGRIGNPPYVSVALWLILLCVALLALTNCTPPTVAPTPTPTRTPSPTPTLTPSATATPTPTPTPAFPVSVGCDIAVPGMPCAALRAAVQADPAHFTWVENQPGVITLGTAPAPGAAPIGAWTYAVAAPFFTVTDGVSTTELLAAWQGAPSEAWGARPLLVMTNTLTVLTDMWGTPGLLVQTVSTAEILTRATELDAWAIIPFQALVPQWKVLRVDGLSLLEKGGDLSAYPLTVPLYLGSATRPETLELLEVDPVDFTNRDENRMTLVVMTGVTAMTRATGQLMDRLGVTYPAKDIKPWFTDADFVHISNEVSFQPDCVAEGSGTMSFCSHDSYIALLEEIKTNIVELTGNHLEDKGAEWVDYSLEMYRERGWQWFGGGANQAEGARPLTITHGVNPIAFIGCNTVGPFAGEDSGGAARCDFDQVRSDIAALRAAGYQPIVTVQYLEDYNYSPTAPQMRDFRSLAEAGAVYVQGSQAHQAQTFEFYGDAFIHYGLGNFFFDQMWSDGTRQEFVNRLTFYDGRLLSIDVRPAIMEEYGRVRPMTDGDPDPAADRAAFLQMMFDLSPGR